MMYSIINDVRQYDDGFKTQKDIEIGPHVKMEHGILKEEKLSWSDKLVYIFLLSRANPKRQKVHINYRDISDRLGYSTPKIGQCIESLKREKYLIVDKISTKKKVGKNNKVKNVNYNVYSFPNNDFFEQKKSYERFTRAFIDTKLIDVRAKEFLIAIAIHILPNDALGSIDHIYDMSVFSKITGWSRSTVFNRIRYLREKGLMTDYFVHYPMMGEVCVGYKIDMKTIMLDSICQLQKLDGDRLNSDINL